MQHDAFPYVAHAASAALGVPDLYTVALPISANVFTGLAYLGISAAIVLLRRRRQDLAEHRALYILFASFIFWCAMHHLTHAASYVWPIARLQVMVDSLTAVVSLAAAYVVWRSYSHVAEMPHPREYTRAHEMLVEREQELAENRALEQWRDEFLSAASHELRNPLAAQRLSLELLREHALAGRHERCVELLDDLAHHGAHLERITDDLADITRAGSNQMRYSFGETDLHAVVDRVVRHIARERTQPALEVNGSVPRAVRADMLRIEQVLHNLLNNALKYAPESTRIRITLRDMDTHAVVSVSDEGRGIRESERDRLFERFYRGTHAEGTVVGLGIGLFLSKVIVEDHGGTIMALNNPHGGATFTFTLPYA